jgi:hypothetical protein
LWTRGSEVVNIQITIVEVPTVEGDVRHAER